MHNRVPFAFKNDFQFRENLLFFCEDDSTKKFLSSVFATSAIVAFPQSVIFGPRMHIARNDFNQL